MSQRVRILRQVIGSFREASKGGLVQRELRASSIYVLLILSVALLTLAYQIDVPIEIDLGERGDSPYIGNFWDPETEGDISFRWSSHGSYMYLPGTGGDALANLRIRLNGWRPEGVPSPQVTLAVNGHHLAQFTPSNQFQDYDFLVPEQLVGFSGNLKIEIDAETFVPNDVVGGGDLRRLGVLVDSLAVQLESGRNSIITPPPLQAIHFAGGGLALYVLARWLLPRKGAFALATLILAALSVAMAWKRIHLAPHSLWIATIPLLALIIMELARRRPTMQQGIPLASALVVATVLGVKKLAWIASLAAMGIAPDLANNYAAATILRSGEAIYNLDSSLFVGYDNPPLTALLTTPLTLLNFRTAAGLFFLINFGFLLTSVALVCVSRREYLLRYPYWLLAPALVLNLDPVQDSLLLGQLDCTILLLITVCYWAYRNRRDALAGLSLGLAAMIKISPALLVAYFLFKRQFRVFAWATASAALVGTLSLLFAGTDSHVLFVTRILPTLLAGSAQMENQSLSGFFNRLFLGPSFTTDLAQAPPLPQVRVLTLVTSLVMVAASVFLVRRKLSNRDDLRFDLEFSLLIIALPLISSIAWHHYMTWYTLPFLVLLNPALWRSLSRGSRLALTFVGCLFYASLCVPIASYGASFLQGPAELMLSLRLYGALAFYGIFAYLLEHQATDTHTTD